MNKDELIGQKFNYLTIISKTDDYISPKGQHQTRYLCKCKCGKEIKVQPYLLRNGKIKSC